MRSNMSLGLAAIVASSLGLGIDLYPDYDQYRTRRDRDFTLDEVEAQWVHYMMAHLRRVRRQEERERRREKEAQQRAEAAAIEAARPKSRQELRAKARKAVSIEIDKLPRGHPASSADIQSNSLKRLLRKTRRK